MGRERRWSYVLLLQCERAVRTHRAHYSRFQCVELLAVLKGHSTVVKGIVWDPIGTFLATQVRIPVFCLEKRDHPPEISLVCSKEWTKESWKGWRTCPGCKMMRPYWRDLSLVYEDTNFFHCLPDSTRDDSPPILPTCERVAAHTDLNNFFFGLRLLHPLLGLTSVFCATGMCPFDPKHPLRSPCDGNWEVATR